MIPDRAKRATSSTLIQPGQFSTALLRLAHSAPGDGACTSGVAAFPRRPIVFLWHYIRRRPLLHFAALASVLVAASCACAAQYGLKLIVDAMAQGVDHIALAWRALAVFAGLLAGESPLWRLGSWLGYRAIFVDKAEAKLDLFDHLGGHFTDLLSGSLANRISSTGDAVQQTLSIVLFNIAPVCADFCAALVILATVGWRLVVALGLFVLVAAGTLASAFRTARHTAPPRLCRPCGRSRRCARRCRLQYLDGEGLLCALAGASALWAAAEY
jgi:ABC-type multidrug transport system fused ATPase/permease subunit